MMWVQGVLEPSAAGRPREPLTTAGGIGGSSGFGAVLDHVMAQGKVEAAASQAASERQALAEAAASFEALLLYQMLQAMRKTVPKGGLIDTGFAGETYLGMLDDALAQEMAKAGGIGLAKILLDQLA